MTKAGILHGSQRSMFFFFFVLYIKHTHTHTYTTNTSLAQLAPQCTQHTQCTHLLAFKSVVTEWVVTCCVTECVSAVVMYWLIRNRSMCCCKYIELEKQTNVICVYNDYEMQANYAYCNFGHPYITDVKRNFLIWI